MLSAPQYGNQASLFDTILQLFYSGGVPAVPRSLNGQKLALASVPVQDQGTDPG